MKTPSPHWHTQQHEQQQQQQQQQQQLNNLDFKIRILR
jgi:hypothetical protein